MTIRSMGLARAWVPSLLLATGWAPAMGLEGEDPALPFSARAELVTSGTYDRHLVKLRRELRLRRDALLAVMFLHANSGGFDGQFTSSEAMNDLRGSLLEATRDVIGDDVYSVLVTDILRQDT